MNSQQFALFALATLCFLSLALSQSTSGGTTGGIRKDSATSGNSRNYYGRSVAAEANVTASITVTTVLDVWDIGSNDSTANASHIPSSAVINYLNVSGKPFPPNTTTYVFRPVNATFITNVTYVLHFVNNDTSSPTSPTSNFWNATGTTNVTKQIEMFNTWVYEMFIDPIHSIYIGSNVNYTIYSTTGVADVIPGTPVTTTTTTTATIATATGTHTSSTTNRTSATSAGTSLSLSSPSWMSVGTIACLLLAYFL